MPLINNNLDVEYTTSDIGPKFDYTLKASYQSEGMTLPATSTTMLNSYLMQVPLFQGTSSSPNWLTGEHDPTTGKLVIWRTGTDLPTLHSAEVIIEGYKDKVKQYSVKRSTGVCANPNAGRPTCPPAKLMR